MAIQRQTVSVFIVIVAAIAGLFHPAAPASAADDAKAEPKPMTTANPMIAIDQLKIMLRPLRKDELQIEAEAWIELVRRKSLEIANAELGVKKSNEEMDKAAEKADEADAKVDEAKEKADEKKEEADTKKEEADTKKEEEAKDTAAKDAPKDAAPVDPDAAKAKADADKAKADADKAKVEADAVKAKAEADAKQAADKKETLLEDINVLREQRTALIDRAETVLDAFKAKGGEIEQYELYLTAVSGITLDVTDTGAFWSAIKGWLLSSEGGLRWLRNIGLFLLMVLIAWIVARIIGAAVQKAVNRTQRFSVLLRQFITGIVRKVIFFVGFVIALSMLEIDIGPMLAAIGAVGFIIAFALQETLGNFAAGVMILIYRPFDVKDFVDIGGTTGTVRNLTLVSTTLLTPDNKLVIVPNNKIWGGVITNFSANATRRVDMTFGVGYDDDLQKTAQILEEIITKHEKVLKDPAPVVKIHELGASSVNFIVRPWVNTADYWTVFWDVTREVKKRFDEAGISIPYPQQDVHMYHVEGPKGPPPQATPAT